MPRKMKKSRKISGQPPKVDYDFRQQVGFLLRTTFQRHTAIFMERMVPTLTQTQLATLATLYYSEPLPHNELGQQVGLDASTIKGVVDRLKARGFIKAWTTQKDRRSRTVTLTAKGRKIFEKAATYAHEITRETIKPLSAHNQKLLINFLKQLSQTPAENSGNEKES